MNKRKEFIDGLKAGIPIGLAYLAVSFTFGISSIFEGLSVGEAVLVSATNLTSAGQFAGLSVISASGTYFEMFLTQFVINLRYFLMSFSLSQKLDRRESFYNRFLIAFGITDEIFAVSISQKGKVSSHFIYGALLISTSCWCFGTFLGALLGSILPHFIVDSLLIAIYAMFISIIITPSKHNLKILYVVVASMLLSCFMYYMPYINQISDGFKIIIVTVVISCIAAKLFPIKEEQQ